MTPLSEIEAFHKVWIGSESHKAFCKFYSEVGMSMNVKNVCHDHLAAGIWRAVEKWIHEEHMKLLETEHRQQKTIE
jgi:hypothetical protein